MKNILILLLFFVSFITYGQNNGPTPEQVRTLIAKSITDLNVSPEPVAQIINDFVLNEKDSIAIRIYRPLINKILPVIYLIHGAGFVAGDLETHDNICRYLSNNLQSVVVAVDYRRPPEHKFPIPFDDSYFIFKWIYSHMKQLKGNGKLILIGDSAGGQIVAAICIVNSTDIKPIPVLAQVLVNPALDLSKGSVSYNTYALFIEWYLNKTDSTNDVRISPLLAKDIKNAPSAIIVVGEKDEIRNDGEAFNKRLVEAGIASSLFIQPDMGHLAEHWCAADETAKPAMNFVVKTLKELYLK